MKGLIPYASLGVASGSGTQLLSTTPAALNWTTLGAAAGDYTAGDFSARPDLANNRLILAPNSTYDIEVNLNGTIDAGAVITLQLRKNGVNVAGGRSQLTWVISTAQNRHTLKARVTTTDADNPGTISNFADPASTSFTGAGGATKQGIPLDVTIAAGAGTPTVTIGDALFSAVRIG
jgi:hypothetical protein